MAKTLEIQKEFENLISELEKLKNINEITSSNTTNTKKIINEIDSFVKATKDLEDEIHKDFNQKKHEIGKLLESVSNTISDINKSHEEHKEIIERHTESLIKASSEEISEIINQLKENIKDYQQDLSNQGKNIDSSIN